MTEKSNILYIEDEQLMIDMVDQILNMSGYNYHIFSTTSGSEGLTLIREKKPDIILLDLTMPETNGWDIYRALKQDDILENIPVIVISATVPENGLYIIEGFPPVEDYITKPFDVSRLLRSIREVSMQLES